MIARLRTAHPRCALFSLAVLTGSSAVYAAAPDTVHSEDSAINKRDRYKSAVTADQQSNKKSDIELTRNIRRSITKDDKLSMDAHNVKIITQNGKVTLRGPVNSAQEKATVERKAHTIAGANNVHSELQVASNDKT